MSTLALAVGVLPAGSCVRGDTDTGDTAAVDTPAATVVPPSSAAPSASEQPGAGGRDQSELFVILEPVAGGHAVAELLVTDPGGRRTGVDSGSFRSLAEILHASYDSAPPPTQTDGDPEPGPLTKQLSLVTPTPGSYTVAVVGRRAGAYSLVVRVTTPSGDVREGAVRGARIRAGDVHRFVAWYDPAHTGPLALARQ